MSLTDMKKLQKEKGFTIVELLIVIVVIAILAAISIVAYNGMQSRAGKSAIASYASSALKALQAYRAGEGKYPAYTGCIGAGYVDRNGNGTADCRWTSTTDSYTVNASLNSELGKYTNIKDMGAPSQMTGSATQFVVGGHYSATSVAILDGVPHQTWFTYAVPDRSCPVGPIARMTGWPNLVIDSSATYSEAWMSGSLCWIPLK